MWSEYTLSTQLRVKQTTSNQANMMMNGKLLGVKAYVFSTDVIKTVEYNASSPP